MCARNLAAVVANDREAGVRLFVLAGAILDASTYRRLVEVMGVPVRVMRVEAPLDEIERRLAGDPTSGRADDLLEAREWIASGQGLPFNHHVIVNVGPLRPVAEEILARWLD
jgi:hypothetical protein